MHTVTISTSQSPANVETHLRSFWEGLTEAVKQKSRIYRTYVDAPEGRFVLMTTSKDLHLKLGSFDYGVNYHFAKLLEEEFDRHGIHLLLLRFVDSKQGFEKGMLVTMAKEGTVIVFTLALAS